jgi:hypothetical protein
VKRNAAKCDGLEQTRLEWKRNDEMEWNQMKFHDIESTKWNNEFMNESLTV